MTAKMNKQYVVIRVGNVADEADFFSRIFDAAAMVVDDKTRQLETGAFILRMAHTDREDEFSRGVHFEISVSNVNQFAEDVWNRGIKYASRPQNYNDGFRKVGFVSPGNIRVDGIGPLKLDSTGSFPAFKENKQAD